MCRSGPGSAGFTLVELIIAIVIIGIGAAAIMGVFATTIGASADPMVSVQARSVATAYMDEILLRRYGDGPDDCAGGGRGSWETIWCYNNIPSGGEPPADQFGNPISGLSDYSVSVVVAALGADVASVDVTVDHTSGLSYTLTSRRGDY